MENIIAVGDELRRCFYKSGLDFLTGVPQQRIQEIILSMAQKGHTGKMTDCSEVGTAHRTTYGFFLSKGKWNHEEVKSVQRKLSFNAVLEEAQHTKQPIYVRIDDTVVAKKKPSSRAVHPTEGTGWHYSHLEKKQVYGFQMHTAIISTGNNAICYSLRRCCPEHGTKVDMSVEVIAPIPKTKCPVYVLADSWYSNISVWNSCIEKGYHLIGAMKTNRTLYYSN